MLTIEIVSLTDSLRRADESDRQEGAWGKHPPNTKALREQAESFFFLRNRALITSQPDPRSRAALSSPKPFPLSQVVMNLLWL